MDKKEQNSDKLKLLIKSLVKEELKNNTKEIAKIIKEQVRLQVKQQVNEILAEQFLKNISTNNSLNQVFTEKAENQNRSQENAAPAKNKRLQEAERAAIKEKYNQKLRNLGVLGTEAQSLFEDIQPGPIAAAPSGIGNPLENDDEGVDLSRFGL